MATQYRRNLTFPEEFPSILKCFARETIRSQPEDIYEFAAAYFAQQLQLSKTQPKAAEVTETKPLGKTLSSYYDQVFRRLKQQIADSQGVSAAAARQPHGQREIVQEAACILSKSICLLGMGPHTDAAVGLAQLDSQGYVDVPDLANSSSQLLHEMLSDSFAPVREDALARYAESPVASLVCGVAPADLQAILTASLDAACGESGAVTFSQAQTAIAELATGSLEMTLKDANVVIAALMPGPSESSKKYDADAIAYLVKVLQESQKEAFVRQHLQVNAQ